MTVWTGRARTLSRAPRQAPDLHKTSSTACAAKFLATMGPVSERQVGRDALDDGRPRSSGRSPDRAPLPALPPGPHRPADRGTPQADAAAGRSSAYRDGDRIVVLIPATFSMAEERRWVAAMVERLRAQENRRKSPISGSGPARRGALPAVSGRPGPPGVDPLGGQPTGSLGVLHPPWTARSGCPRVCAGCPAGSSTTSCCTSWPTCSSHRTNPRFWTLFAVLPAPGASPRLPRGCGRRGRARHGAAWASPTSPRS